MYAISDCQTKVFKNGTLFFTTPIANEYTASLVVGLVLPDVATNSKDDSILPGYCEPYWGNDRTAVLVAGGGCCDGYLIGISFEGKITKILAIDFNIKRIVPIIYSVPTIDPEKGEVTAIGLLVSGSGCSGSGVRFVDFNRVTPVAIPVVGSEEKEIPTKSWLYGLDPLSMVDIWDRLHKIGINADRERTEKAVKAFVPF